MNSSKKIFTVSALISIAIALTAIFFQDTFSSLASSLMELIKSAFSSFYLYTELFFVAFVLIIALSPWGRIRLGKDDEGPEYSTLSWFAMLFAAGMGIGLVFWGIAEPLSHYIVPMAGIEPSSDSSRAFSIRSCFMHWGMHPWSCYAIVGLGLAYFQFRKGETMLISNIMKPIFGDKGAKGILGQFIDVLTTVITVVGVASSFGMGCMQVSAGLHYVLGIPDNKATWIIIIVIVTICFMTSALKGVDRGIKILSNTNMFLCGLLLLLAFLVGPKLEIISDTFVGIRDYILYFIQDSARTHAANGDTSWIRGWRVYYWAWWISWVPFVGAFIARISKGRTIRGFVLGSTVIPTLVSCIWFGTFGTDAIHVAGRLTADELTEIINIPQIALFRIFAEYPMGLMISVIAMVLCLLFYITSADSATFVLGILTSGGDPNPDNRVKAFWGVLIAVMAYALISLGGVQSIQTMSIIIALPYVFVMLLVCINLVIAIYQDWNRPR